MKGKKYYSNIITDSKNKDFKFIRFKDIYFSHLKIYDINDNLIDYSKLIKETKVKCMIILRSVWINEENYGIKLILLQIQYRELLTNNSLFKKTDDDLVITQNVSSMPLPPPPPPHLHLRLHHRLHLKIIIIYLKL